MLDTVLKRRSLTARRAESIREMVVVRLDDLAERLSSDIFSLRLQFGARGFKATEEFIADARRKIAATFRRMREDAFDDLKKIAADENAALPKMLNELFGVKGHFKRNHSKAQVESLVGELQVRGMSLPEWWQRQSRDFQDRFSQQVRLAHATGLDRSSLIDRAFGVKSNRTRSVVVDGRDRVLNERGPSGLTTAKQRASALALTAVRQIEANLMDSIDDELKQGTIWISVLDDRTTDLCRSLSNAMWDKNGDPLPASSLQEKKKYSSPAHWKCRSIELPLFKPFDELKAAVPSLSDEMKDGMDGQPPASQSYQQWLESKPESVQKDILGEAKWARWRSGGLSLSEMVDQSGRAIPLADLVTEE